MYPSKVCDPNWVRKAICEYFEEFIAIKEIVFLPQPIGGISYYVESVEGEVFEIDQALFSEICVRYLTEDEEEVEA